MASTDVLEALFRKAGTLPSVAQLDAIREATCAYVDAAKSEGALPEQIVIELRAAERRSHADVPSSVVDALVAECLKRYFLSRL